MNWKYFTFFTLTFALLSACSPSTYVDSLQHFKGGNASEGQELKLYIDGQFSFYNWMDYDHERIRGNYIIKGKTLILNTELLPDSLRLFERIDGEPDSLYLKFEIWDTEFENHLSAFTHLRARFYYRNELTKEYTIANGYLQVEKFKFDHLEIISSGVLMKKSYHVQHPESNYFYGQYRFGNSHLSHLLFTNEEWIIKDDKVTGHLYKGKGHKKITLELE
ncbi:MAG: hypothetical protein MK212_08700 [Saprospiraceae bacterium]|nr:hypothetical protein [Saprospiraceae bacterium]